MIKIENIMQAGFKPAIRGMRNSWNSWDKSDSLVGQIDWGDHNNGEAIYEYGIGPNDLELMKKLINAGAEHRKFMRFIIVWCDITAPLYWWKQMDTYKIGVTVNSCSTMHTIHDKRFEASDFSFASVYVVDAACTISLLNKIRDEFIETKNKDCWNAIIQLLPESYNQRRTVCLNYEVLYNIYHQRKGHKLGEWHEFCDFIKTLPYMEEFLSEEEEE